MRPLFILGALLLVCGGLYLLREPQPPRKASVTEMPSQHEVPTSPQSFEKPASTEASDAHAAEVAKIDTQITSASPLKRGQIRNDEVIALLRRLSELDPEGAVRLAFEQERIHGDPELPDELFTHWLSHSTATAEHWFGSLPPGELRSRVSPAVMSLLAAKAPERGIELLDSLQGELRRRSIAVLFSGWSEHAPDTAATEALRIKTTDPDERELAIISATETWAQTDLAAAVAWQANLPWDGTRESALRGLLPEWAANEPVQAAALGESIPTDSSLRGEWLRTVAEQWAAQDADAALLWAQGLTNENERVTALRAAAAELAKEGTESAAERLIALPTGKAREQALELVLNQWAVADRNAATQWCARLPAGQLRDTFLGDNRQHTP